MGRKRFVKNREDAVHFTLVSRRENPEEDEVFGAGCKGDMMLAPYVPHGLARKGVQIKEEAYAIAGMDEDEMSVDGDGELAIAHKPTEEELEDDCFLPKDGYNYEKHMRTIRENHFVAVPDAVDIKEERPQNLSKEEQEALDALEEASLYDEADDDIFDDILGDEMERAAVVEQVTWGDDKNQRVLGHFGPAEDISFSDLDSDEEPDELIVGVSDSVAAARDAKLDKLLADDYDDYNIGELEEDACGGTCDLEDFDMVIDEYHEKVNKSLNVELAECAAADEKAGIAGYENYDPDAPVDEDDFEIVETEAGEDWDCESILSLRSNVSNHPGKIGRIERKKRAPKIETIDEEEEEEEEVELPEVSTGPRPKDETADEKKARKKAVKEMRKICREMKKKNKEVWKLSAAAIAEQRTVQSGQVRTGLRVVPL